MMRTASFAVCLSLAISLSACDEARAKGKPVNPEQESSKKAPTAASTDRIVKSDEEWKKELTPVQYDILRKAGTERAFTGPYWNSHEHAKYLCAACGLELFRSEDKFDSGTGWPSFTQPASKASVESDTDSSLGMERTEVRCRRCGGHLGHVFDDGPRPTGMRYCINGNALKQVPVADKK